MPGFNVHQETPADSQRQQQTAPGRIGDLSAANPSGLIPTSQTTGAATTTTMGSSTTATMSSIPVDELALASGNQTAPIDSGSQDQSSSAINMTNHNLGRPSPRPMTTTTTSLRGSESNYNHSFNYGQSGDLHAHDQQRQQLQATVSGQAERRPLQKQPPPPIKLDPLTAEERQAILDLLSGHEKSSLLFSSNAAGSARTSGSSLIDEQIITSGLMKLYPILESFRHGNSRSRGLIPFNATNDSHTNNSNSSNLTGLTSRSILQDIEALLSEQFNRMELSGNKDDTGGRATTMDQKNNKRTKRDVAEDELRTSSSYVYMRQPQSAVQKQADKLRFTHGHVEMYHTKQLSRIRRQAPAFEEFEAHSTHNRREEPKYELEEMIVQSIKIVDRLQFEDERAAQQSVRRSR